ncbi:MAG TPA: hypothetical protein VH083_06345 [Myxococcales bacterium]|nr:hypothetical protein [Myxococcales bacterium]
MKKMLALMTVLCLAGCVQGLTGDSSFIGTWSGAESISLNSAAPTAANASVQIGDAGNGQLIISLCPDGSGPLATATDDTDLEVEAITCPPAATSTCASASLAIQGGTASLSSLGALSLSVTGTLTGCGSIEPFSVSFTGSM